MTTEERMIAEGLTIVDQNSTVIGPSRETTRRTPGKPSKKRIKTKILKSEKVRSSRK